MSDHTAVEGNQASATAAHDKISNLLIAIGRDAAADEITVGELEDALAERVFGLLLLILALPCCVPFLYGAPQAISLPLLFVATQIVLGRRKPWLPKRLKRHSFSADGFRQMAEKAAPYLRWFEVISRPRLIWLTKGVMKQILGLFIIVFSASIVVPFPLSNTVPGFAIAIMALGFIEKDGVLLVLGCLIGTVWVAFLVTLAGGIFILIQEGLNWLF